MGALRWDAMTPDERAAYVAERVRADCAAQGLPEHVEDPAAIDRLARQLRERGEHRPAELVETMAGREMGERGAS